MSGKIIVASVAAILLTSTGLASAATNVTTRWRRGTTTWCRRNCPMIRHPTSRRIIPIRLEPASPARH